MAAAKIPMEAAEKILLRAQNRALTGGLACILDEQNPGGACLKLGLMRQVE